MGIYRSQPDKNKITLYKSYKGMQFASSHMCGWRLYMEDTSIQEFNFDGQNNHIFGIFDGHGGGQVSIFVKRHFTEQLLKNQHYTKKNFQRALQQTFQKMDQMLKSEQGKKQIRSIQNQLIQQDNLPKRDSKQCAGCTALVCLFTERLLFVSNAGDSRAYAKKNGEFLSLNCLHNPFQTQQQQRILNAGGHITSQGRINGSLNVSRGMGDLDFKCNKKLPSQKQIIISFPEIQKLSEQGIQYLLIGCDGVWQTKSLNQIQEFIDKRLQKNINLQKIVQQMLDWIICTQQNADKTQYGKDNMSIILIKL